MKQNNIDKTLSDVLQKHSDKLKHKTLLQNNHAEILHDNAADMAVSENKTETKNHTCAGCKGICCSKK